MLCGCYVATPINGLLSRRHDVVAATDCRTIRIPGTIARISMTAGRTASLGDCGIWYPSCTYQHRIYMLEKHRTRCVLVIDDDPDMRHVLRDFLRRSGYRVIEAANGQEGIFAAESERIDVVIVDKEMPGMNGLDVLSFFRRRCPRLPIIFITAFGGREDEDESRRRGAWLYIEKPFRLATVVDAVQAVLEKPAP